MHAMVLDAMGKPLRAADVRTPRPGATQVLIRVRACGVCRTDLHVVDGELPDPKLPLIPGHQIVGTVVETGESIDRFASGDRVGVPWLGSTCGTCRYCKSGRENLCDYALFAGDFLKVDAGFGDSFAQGSSATVRWSWRATLSASGCTGSAPPPTS